MLQWANTHHAHDEPAVEKHGRPPVNDNRPGPDLTLNWYGTFGRGDSIGVTAMLVVTGCFHREPEAPLWRERERRDEDRLVDH